MTQVSYELDKNFFSISLEGHATKLPWEDENLCCAAISAMTQTTLQVLYDMEQSKELKRLEYEMEPGKMRIHAKGRGKRSRKLRHHAQMLITGLELIAERYPYAIQFVG